MRTHRYSLLGAVVVVVAAITGGCGGGSGSSSENKPASTASSGSSGGSVIKTVSVHETEYKLSPNAISLDKPGTYVFKGINDGTTDHALAVEGNGLDMDGSDIAPGSGGKLKVTLPKKGTYEIYCPVDGHKGLGMEGKITVGGASAGTGDTHMDETTTQPTTTYSTGY
jgi:plastocyanin